MRTLAWWWLIFTACVSACVGEARAEVRPSICIARDNGTQTPAEMMAARARFDCTRPQMNWGPGDYWARSSILSPRLGRQALVVRTFSMWQNGDALWAHYADGRVLPLPEVKPAGSLGTSVEHIIPVRDVPATRLLWRVREAQNLRGIVLGVRLLNVDERAQGNVTVGLQGGVMAGLCIGFMFFALALWAALRRTFLLAYCSMVGGLLLYLLADLGALHRLYPGVDRLLELRLSNFTATLCVVGGLWFARAFPQSGTLGARCDRIARLAAATVLVIGLVKELLMPWQAIALDRLLGVAMIFALGTIVYMAVRVMQRPNAFRWIWPVTALVPTTLITLRVANTFQLFGRPFAMGTAIMTMMAVGMFVSALAIAYRVHRLGRERDEARAQEVAARLLADTDPLTGLLNRRAFLAQAIGRQGPQMLLITDLDHFKQVNETIGHDGGDEVLRVFARALEACVPEGALVARIGGEEFAVVAAANTGMSARAILQSLRTARMPYDIAVTTSIGTCTGALERETDWKTLYRRADRALYAAKAAGRDRVRDAETVPLAA